MGVINPEAFCELCCKEFCNKYFLRTHKHKKHGVPYPEGYEPKKKSPKGKDSSSGSEPKDGEKSDTKMDNPPGNASPTNQIPEGMVFALSNKSLEDIGRDEDCNCKGKNSNHFY